MRSLVLMDVPIRTKYMRASVELVRTLIIRQSFRLKCDGRYLRPTGRVEEYVVNRRVITVVEATAHFGSV